MAKVFFLGFIFVTKVHLIWLLMKLYPVLHFRQPSIATHFSQMQRDLSWIGQTFRYRCANAKRSVFWKYIRIFSDCVLKLHFYNKKQEMYKASKLVISLNYVTLFATLFFLAVWPFVWDSYQRPSHAIISFSRDIFLESWFFLWLNCNYKPFW